MYSQTTNDIIIDICLLASAVVNLCKRGEQNKVNCEILHQ